MLWAVCVTMETVSIETFVVGYLVLLYFVASMNFFSQKTRQPVVTRTRIVVLHLGGRGGGGVSFLNFMVHGPYSLKS